MSGFSKSSVSPLVQAAVLAALSLLSACGEGVEERIDAGVAATVGPEGATLSGLADTALAGVSVVVAPATFAEPTRIELASAADDTPLPEGAHAVGDQVELIVGGAVSAAVSAGFRVTLPFVTAQVQTYGQDFRQVKVWRRAQESTGASEPWTLVEPVATDESTVTIDATGPSVFAPGVKDVTDE